MKRIYPLIIFCSVACAHLLAQDISSVLSSIEQNNLQLQAARDNFRASVIEDEVGNSILGETSVEYSPFYRNGVNGIESSELIVSQEIQFPTVHIGQRRLNTLRKQTFNIEYQILRRNILLQAEQLLHDLTYIVSTGRLYEQRLDISDSLLNAFTQRLESGDATILDVNRIRMDRMTIMAESSQIQSQQSALLLQLQVLNGGIPIEINKETTIGVEEPETPSVPLPSASQMLESQLALANLNAQNHEVNIARQEFLPNITIGYRRNTELREASNGFLVGISLPLFTGNRKIKVARLRQSAAEAEAQNTQIEAQNHIDALQAEIIHLQSALAVYNLQLMQQTLTLLRNALLAGQISVIEYYGESDQIYIRMQERLALLNQLERIRTELKNL